jgi:beta-lactamase regulating signal transducer with metallopeptidase domain
VEVLVSRSTDAPCVVGGHIVLPARCVRDLTPDQIHAVLAHEVAHLVRRDPAWIAFGDLICRALWLQPLNRLALEGLRASAELACDDWAVGRTRHPLELARSIAKVAEWIHPRRSAPAPALGQFVHLAQGEGRILSERVRRIVTQGAVRSVAPRPLRLLLAVLVVAPTLAVPAVPRTAAVYAVFIREEAVEEGSTPSTEMRAADVVVLVRGAPPGDS